MNCKTREEYLTKAVNYCRNVMFKRYGATIPQVRVSVGFKPGSRPSQAAKSGNFGHYVPPADTADGIGQIYISPVLDKPIATLLTLVDGLVHACTSSMHGPEFERIARLVGLDGPLTAPLASDRLRDELKALADALGDYPHSSVTLKSHGSKGSPLKAFSCKACDYRAWTTAKHIFRAVPICPSKSCTNHGQDMVQS